HLARGAGPLGWERGGAASPPAHATCGRTPAPPPVRPPLGQAPPRVSTTVSEPQARAASGPSRAGLDPRQFLDRLGQGRRASVGAELRQAVLACKPIVAAVVSGKGGVGKTASRAAAARSP